MKLEKILERLNSLEKLSFSKILDTIITNKPKHHREIHKILHNYSDTDLKKLDSHIVAKVFNLVQDEYYKYLNNQINSSVSQLDILIDILVKDGNCIMSREWLGKLYEKELKKIKTKIKELKPTLEESDLANLDQRNRYYKIYRNCVTTAYENDIKNNQDAKITSDEKSILNSLADSLDLSQEEVKLINYSVLPLKELPLEEVIELLKNTGIALYSKKNLTIYIPDEFVRLLRIFRGKEVADKFSKRILKLLKDSHINLVSKKHGIDRKLDRKGKTKAIINEGISLRNLLKYGIHKEGTKVSDKKTFINNLVEKGLGITHLKGVNIDLKLDNLVQYFNDIEREEKIGISIDGYKKLLDDLKGFDPKINNRLKEEFELQPSDVMQSEYLLDYNIKPRDIIEILSKEETKSFCEKMDISTRGNEFMNILNAYTDSKNIQLENYVHIGSRNLEALKENGIKIKEADLGIKFEDITKQIFQELGYNVDETLRKKVSSSKDKIDVLIKIEEQDVILIECKSVKESGYNKFSSVKRQLLAYKNQIEKNGFSVVKSILVAPEFSEEFINHTELDYDLNLSLIKAQSLLDILTSFKGVKKMKVLPHILLIRDVVIQEERVIKAIQN